MFVMSPGVASSLYQLSPIIPENGNDVHLIVIAIPFFTAIIRPILEFVFGGTWFPFWVVIRDFRIIIVRGSCNYC